MTRTKQLATDEHLAEDTSLAPQEPGLSTNAREPTSDNDRDVLSESRTDPASLLRPNPTFPGDEAD